MSANHTISAVIPCYNEGTRILTVLEQISSLPQITEIIIVDDGSTQATKDVLASLPVNYKVITSPQNFGKAHAMSTGVSHATGDIILFVDADITGITPRHLLSLTEPIIDNHADMVIGVREKDVGYSNVFGFSSAYAGERAFRKVDLQKNISIFDCQRYNIEASMNRTFFPTNRVDKILLVGVGQTAKYKKEGLLGLLKSFKMLKSIIDYLTLPGFISQLIYISKLKYYAKI